MGREKKARGGRKPWAADPRLSCLGEFCAGNPGSKTRYEDVRDVDIALKGSSIPYRTRLCPRCRDGIEILFDRGDVNAGK